jgi:hypothetical protein
MGVRDAELVPDFLVQLKRRIELFNPAPRVLHRVEDSHLISDVGKLAPIAQPLADLERGGIMKAGLRSIAFLYSNPSETHKRLRCPPIAPGAPIATQRRLEMPVRCGNITDPLRQVPE